MEWLIFIGVIWFVFSFISGLSESGNSQANMGPFEVRANFVPEGEELSFEFFKLEARGLIPVFRSTNIAYTVSLLDVTDEVGSQPVLCNIDDFGEPRTTAFQLAGSFGEVGPQMGLLEWRRMGAIIPEILTTAHSGTRKIRVIFRLYNENDPIDVHLGFSDPDVGQLIHVARTDIEFNFPEKGYEETAKSRRLLRPLNIRLAVAVAFSDGDFHETEGDLIRKWIERQLSIIPESSRETVRDECNSALRRAYSDGENGLLALSDTCSEIFEHSDISQRYESIELCLDMMAADGRADVAELDVIHRVSDVFELDMSELQKLKDQRMVSLDTSKAFETSEGAMNAALGIGENWSSERTRKHLRAEFKKWNSRLNNLSDQTEKDNVQARIELISKARKHYERPT